MSKLTEPSTWRGVIALVGATIAVQPDHIAPITAAVLALIGAINVGRTGQ